MQKNNIQRYQCKGMVNKVRQYSNSNNRNN